MKPGDLPDLDFKDQSQTAMLADSANSQPFATRWDAREDYRASTDEVLDGDIGETAQGIWATVHPFALYLGEPQLRGPWSRFRKGDQEPNPSDYDTLSNFDLECKNVLRTAANRHLTRKPTGGTNGQ